MNDRLARYYRQLKEKGLSAEQDSLIKKELHALDGGSHDKASLLENSNQAFPSFYQFDDRQSLMNIASLVSSASSNMSTLDELLERDKRREDDGFPRKINVGRIIKPGKGDKDKIVIVPSTVEEKFIHDNSIKPEDESGAGGTGEGEEGEVIGEQPLEPQKGAGSGAGGEGDGSPHEMESNAYELGKILTEKFELPNLKDKGKKRSFTRYTYDLTDKNRGFGQVLDKKSTIKKIIETNFALGRIPDKNQIDTSELLVGPKDKIYRILSREKDYESHAMVFFVRDYSGSMEGKPTVLVCSQHVLIYSWLLYQYSNQVETRFILHDTDAKEVPDFFTYYNSRVAGGTKVASAFKMVNEIVEKENLAKDYNIYVFHGTDGDDWDNEGAEVLPEIEKMLTYANRVGITVAKHSSAPGSNTTVEKYLEKSGLLEKYPELIRMDSMP
ncbi:MAG: DUF444 family protein, partial [Fibrobacteria bacterium]|nr:DUF444 family protein [Fibrobacteria bacterium]